jgi:hypothetical protein
MVSTLAMTDVLAKLLIAKGIARFDIRSSANLSKITPRYISVSY